MSALLGAIIGGIAAKAGREARAHQRALEGIEPYRPTILDPDTHLEVLKGGALGAVSGGLLSIIGGIASGGASAAGGAASAAPAAGEAAGSAGATAANISAGGIEAAGAAPGAVSATGPAVALGGAPTPAAISGLGVGSGGNVGDAAQAALNLAGGQGPGSTANQFATMIQQAGGTRPQFEHLTQAGQALADRGADVASSTGFPGPSYPQFQQATQITQGVRPTPFSSSFYANYGAKPATNFGRFGNALGRLAVNTGANAITERDPRKLAIGAGTSALSSGIGYGLDQAVPRYGADLLTPGQAGSVAEGYGHLFDQRFDPVGAESARVFPSPASNQLLTGMHQSDMLRGYGVDAMDAVRSAGIGQVASRGSGAVAELLNRPPEPAMPTSGPALYQSMRPQPAWQASRPSDPGLYRYLRRA